MKKATSVGGVIVRANNDQPEILLIQAKGWDDWFLPKGHADEGETPEQTAMREIEEETGLTDLEISEFLGEFERYAEQADEMKTEKYFLIRKTGDAEPRVEPGQDWIIKWFGQEQLPTFYIDGQEKIIRGNWDKIERLVNGI